MIRKLFTAIKLFALWVVPVSLCIGYAIAKSFQIEITFQNVFVTILVSLCIQALIWSDNTTRQKRGQDVSKMDFINLTKFDNFSYDDGRERAKLPTVNPKMITPVPYGHFIFGSPIGDSKSYVAKPVNQEGHIAIIGGSGSGKTQSLLASLASLRGYGESYAHYLAIDPKAEITDKLVHDNDGTIIFNPSDRKSWGYNPLYNLSENSSEQEIYVTFKEICSALLPIGTGDMAFWQTLAQTATTAFMMYEWQIKKFRTLPEIVSEIMSKPITELVNEVFNKSASGSKCRQMIASYKDMPSDTIGSISANMQALSIYYLDSDVMFSLGHNKRMFTPTDLLNHDIHVCINLENMERYSSLILLVLQQCVSFCLNLPDASNDPTRKPIYIVMEELVAVLDSLHASIPPVIVTGARFLRSRHCYLCLVAQSLSGLLAVSGNNTHAIDDLLSNIQYLWFADATTPETIKMISDYCGTYAEKHVSMSGTGTNKTQQISYSEAPIMRSSDLLTLGASDRCILISRIGGFNMLEKVAIWKDPVLKKHLN